MVDFTILVLEGAYGSGVSVTLDLLEAARTLAARSAQGTPAPTWQLRSVTGGAVRLSSGLTVDTRALPQRARHDRSTWIIPGLALDSPAQVRAGLARADLQAAARAVARHVARGGQVAAGCSAVFLLHQAGVLAGRRVTTTWWLAPLLGRLEPRCRVDADAMVCVDGPVTTAGAAFAQTDLMLHLLRRLCGPKLTDALARTLLVDARQSQAAYTVPEMLAGGDELVARLVARVEASLPDAPSVAALADGFGVSQRTLSRHVFKATGKRTVDLVQGVRLRTARALLEKSRQSVEDVAAAVGYSDPTALRRLMKRMTGAGPSRWRPAVARAVVGGERPPRTASKPA
jgi:transcriptional regulator GlxA family with amidase domain